jgi:hypothetical protein
LTTGIKADLLQIRDEINIFVLESAVLALGRLGLCGFIQIGHTPAESASIRSLFLVLSEKKRMIVPVEQPRPIPEDDDDVVSLVADESLVKFSYCGNQPRQCPS